MRVSPLSFLLHLLLSLGRTTETTQQHRRKIVYVKPGEKVWTSRWTLESHFLLKKKREKVAKMHLDNMYFMSE